MYPKGQLPVAAVIALCFLEQSRPPTPQLPLVHDAPDTPVGEGGQKHSGGRAKLTSEVRNPLLLVSVLFPGAPGRLAQARSRRPHSSGAMSRQRQPAHDASLAAARDVAASASKARLSAARHRRSPARQQRRASRPSQQIQRRHPWRLRAGARRPGSIS